MVQSNMLANQNIVDRLNKAMSWRYATKIFDKTRSISSEDLAVLQDSLIFSPSSFGLQPYHFIFVESLEVRQKLTPYSWNQLQIEQASHLVVFTARNNIDEEYLDRFLLLNAKIRNTDVNNFKSYKEMMVASLINTNKNIFEWSSRQAYIALGNLMTTSSLLGIDTCPIEGFDNVAYDNILNVDLNYNSVCVCAIGYRSQEDKYQHLAKVRFANKDLIYKI